MKKILNKAKPVDKARYSISAELIKGEELTRKMFSPLVRNKERARLYVLLIAKRQGYDGVKFGD